jgi:hypothetical protein
MSSLIRGSLKENKNRQKWETLVSYTVQELKMHLEDLFENGMSWDNYGEWHIDHIVPQSWFKYNNANDKDFKKCWALENLQPLWEKANCSKGNRYAG